MAPKNNQKGQKRRNLGSSPENDWISQLAKQVSEGTVTVPTKDERILRRNAKKRRRQEKRSDHVEGQREHKPAFDQNTQRMDQSQLFLDQLSSYVLECVQRLNTNEDKWPKLFQPEEQRKGKATAGNPWNEDLIQPRNSEYGGLGLARESLFIPLRDPSFIPRLEDEFAEHIQGFFGKQRTKAMKKQLDGNMLWRQLVDKRVHDKKINGRKLGDMSVDERVSAMIEAGMA